LLAPARQQGPQRPGGGGQDHVVDGAAVGVAQVTGRGEIGGDHVKPPLRPGRPVQRGRRQPAGRTGAAQFGEALTDPAQAAGRVGEVAQELAA
jgi:hypothetical protein